MNKFTNALVAILLLLSSSSQADDYSNFASVYEDPDKFAENVILHVVLHEIGHALIREFDLPVLGNEETMADSFATHFLIEHLPDRAQDSLASRVLLHMMESKKRPRSEWNFSGEHNNHERRANQITALAMGGGVEKYRNLVEITNMSVSAVKQASDYSTEIHRSWRRILQPLTMPEGRKSTETRVVPNYDNELLVKLISESLITDITNALQHFDWHSQISIIFAEGNGSAIWRRNGRTITVYSKYVERIIEQANKANNQTSEKPLVYDDYQFLDRPSSGLDDDNY